MSRARAAAREVAAMILGLLFSVRAGGPWDAGVAVRHFKSACTAGIARGCAFAGLLSRFATADDSPDILMQRACDAGDEYGCVLLKHHAAKAAGKAGAEAGLDESCEDGFSAACVARAQALAKDDADANHDEIVRLHRLGCEAGGDASCRYLAQSDATPSPDDDIWSDGCDASSVTACLYQQLSELSDASPRRKRMLDRLCTLKDVAACYEAGELWALAALTRP